MKRQHLQSVSHPILLLDNVLLKEKAFKSNDEHMTEYQYCFDKLKALKSVIKNHFGMKVIFE